MFGKIKQILWQINAKQEASSFPVCERKDVHTCVHCGASYVGRYCPQCGLDVHRSRFTLKAVVGKVADSLGFDESGNRSIMRTLRDLLWRPGYMIRDYLSGHSPAYFQPFKLLLLLTILFTLLLHVTGLTPDDEMNVMDRINEKMDDNSLRSALQPFFRLLRIGVQWIDSNIAYSIIMQNILVVTAMYKVYRRRSAYSWTETFVAQMYICCQFMMIAIVQLLVTWQYEDSGLFPYFVADWIVILVSLYDFFQLYGERRILPAIWRFLKVGMWLFLYYTLIVLIFILVGVIYVAITNPESLQ